MRHLVPTILAWVLTLQSVPAESPGDEPFLPPPEAVPRAVAPAHLPTAGRSNDIPFWRDPNRWSFQVGVAFITESTINDLLVGQPALARGDAEGQIYLLEGALKLTSFEPTIAGVRIELDLHLPVVLGLVDERGSHPFPQYSAGVMLQWKTFPWNRWLQTTFESAIGLTYSQQVLAVQRQRYPDRDRSHLEFYWPLQLTLALPRHPQHQLVLFNHHHSGGTLFHKGGANSLGVGYRLRLGGREPASFMDVGESCRMEISVRILLSVHIPL
jgi:hypothetical protein